jgi:hypothetical protein
MTLIVEDGTGKVDAESYLSTAAADTYFSNLGNSSWTGSTAVKEAALRKATTYLDSTYRWAGEIFSVEQSLNWPRISVYDSQGRDLSETVPTLLKNACAELALISLTETLVPIVDSANYIKREKVGSLEVEYKDNSPSTKQFIFVDRLLSDLYVSKSGNSNVTLVRA